jgi:hypothetical protein
MKFAFYMDFSFITFFHIRLVTVGIIVYMVVCFVCTHIVTGETSVLHFEFFYRG